MYAPHATSSQLSPTAGEDPVPVRSQLILYARHRFRFGTQIFDGPANWLSIVAFAVDARFVSYIAFFLRPPPPPNS